MSDYLERLGEIDPEWRALYLSAVADGASDAHAAIRANHRFTSRLIARAQAEGRSLVVTDPSGAYGAGLYVAIHGGSTSSWDSARHASFAAYAPDVPAKLAQLADSARDREEIGRLRAENQALREELRRLRGGELRRNKKR